MKVVKVEHKVNLMLKVVLKFKYSILSAANIIVYIQFLKILLLIEL